MRSAPPRDKRSFREVIGSGNPEAHDYEAGLREDAGFQEEDVVLREDGRTFYSPELDPALPTSDDDSVAAGVQVTMDLPRPDEVIEVRLSATRCFGLLRDNCPAATRGVFRAIAEAFVRHDVDGAAIVAEAILHDYYERAPETAAHVLGLPSGHELGDYPPLAAVLPWMRAEPRDRLLELERGILDYWRSCDLTGYGVTDGRTEFGPCSRRTVRHAVKIMRETVTSVREKGGTGVLPYLGSLIADDRAGAYVVHVPGSFYHVAALAVLGHDSTRIKIDGAPVLRSESARWYHVQTGLFTESEALRVFDRYFEGTL